MKKFERPLRKVTQVFIHCSASDNPAHDDVEVIRHWHVAQRGWADVGYHYFITSAGAIQEGRDLERNPAAQRGHNAGTIAICLHGLTRFSEAQFESLRELCGQINAAYDGTMRFRGHSEVSSKPCPVFDYRVVLGLDDKGRITAVGQGEPVRKQSFGPVATAQPVIDSIVESVREKYLERSKAGIKKYKASLDRDDLTDLQWMIHAQEEAMDMVLYLEKMIKNHQRLIDDGK